MSSLNSTSIRSLSLAGTLPSDIRDHVFSSHENEFILLQSQILFDEAQFDEALRKINLYLENVAPDSYELAYGLFTKSWTIRALGRQAEVEIKMCNADLSRVAQQLNDPYLIALALFRTGDEFFCEGKLSETNHLWTESLRILSALKLTHTYEYAYLNFHMGLLYRDQFGFKVAIHYLNEALSKARTAPYPFLVRQILTELFFCCFYQNDINSARLCYEQIQHYKRSHISEIDNAILEAYFDLFHKRIKGARQNLVKAQQLIRKSKIAKNRFDMYFHFAYLYTKCGEYKKASSFMRGSKDPIYHLTLMSLQLDQDPTIEVLQAYELLAYKAGISFHINNARVINSVLVKNKNVIYVDLVQNHIFFRRKKLELNSHSLSWRLFNVAMKNKALSKEDILHQVFEFKHYEPILHDQKVYRLVSQMNKIIGIPFLVVYGEDYVLNPKIEIVNLSEDQVSRSTVIKEVIIEMLGKQKSQPLKTLLRRIGLKPQEASKEISDLQKEHRIRLSSWKDETQIELVG